MNNGTTTIAQIGPSVSMQPFLMGVESEQGGVIPTEFESERAAGSDHDAPHGDPDERPAFTDPVTTTGLFG